MNLFIISYIWADFLSIYRYIAVHGIAVIQQVSKLFQEWFG